MDKVIIYSNEEGGVTIVVPALNCGLTIEQIALKDVPNGVPFKIINKSELPNDREFRNAWEANISSPDGVGLGHDEWFAQQELNQ